MAHVTRARIGLGLATIIVAAAGCGVFGGGSASPTGATDSIVASATFACERAGNKWGATLSAKKLTKCIFHKPDNFLELRIANDEESALDVQIADFTGSGTYITSPGAKSTRVGVVARGGAEGTTATSIDTEGASCTAACTIEVGDAKVTTVDNGGRGSLSLAVNCPSLAHGDPCTTCQSLPPSIGKVDIQGCLRAD